MPMEDDDRPRKKVTHEIGQDLSLLSVEELTERVALLTTEIARLEAALADPTLYGRDPAGFDRIMKAGEKARAELTSAEEEWLALEEKRESLGS